MLYTSPLTSICCFSAQSQCGRSNIVIKTERLKGQTRSAPDSRNTPTVIKLINTWSKHCSAGTVVLFILCYLGSSLCFVFFSSLFVLMFPYTDNSKKKIGLTEFLNSHLSVRMKIRKSNLYNQTLLWSQFWLTSI